MKRIAVAITGATGSIYGIRLLEVLRPYPDVETHLLISAPGKRTLVEETSWTVADVMEVEPELMMAENPGVWPA